MKYACLQNICALVIKRGAAVVVLGLCAVLIAGCGSGVPSPDMGRTVLEEFIKTDWQRGSHIGDLKIVSFKKTNGLSSVKDGVKYYHMNFEAEIEFLKNLRMYHLTDGRIWVDGYMTVAPAPAMIREFPEFSHSQLEGVITFVLTERGWVKSNVSLPKISQAIIAPDRKSVV